MDDANRLRAIQKQNRTAKRVSRLRDKSEYAKGKVWENGRWIDPTTISRGKAMFILRNLTKPSERALFMKLYGDKIRGGVTPEITKLWRRP